MLQKSYSNYIKKKRFERKKKRLHELFLREGVYDEIQKAAQKIEISDFSVSIVSAVYNAENEIDEFIRSVVNQSISFEKSFELILVDDGSIDSSWQKCTDWANKYPDNIFCFQKENGGAASARNFGLNIASEKWVTFIDPDDFVNQKYFENIEAFLSSGINEPDLVSCKLVVYKPDSHEITDTHPLTYKYKKGNLLIDVDSCPEYAVQLSASSCLFKTKKIKELGLVFPNIKPSFEDGFFVNEYLLNSNRLLALVPDARYFYRKKENSTSLVSTSWSQKEKFDEQILWYKELLQKSVEIDGTVCDWIKYVVAYDLMWHFTYLVGNENRISFLTESEKENYKEALFQVFERMDMAFLDYLRWLGLGEFYLKGISSYFYAKDDNIVVSIVDYDDREKIAKYRFFSSSGSDELKILSAGSEVDTVFRKTKKTTFLNKVFAYEISGWFPICGNEFIRFKCNDKPAVAKIGRKPGAEADKGIFAKNILRFYKRKSVNVKKLEKVKRIYRAMAKSELCAKYKNCWLLMDRDTQADDNAEHLYDFLSLKSDKNIWFVVRKDVKDWRRLSEKGFRLIEYGSVQHKLAMLNCEFLISSHADTYILNLISQKHYGDLLKYKFIFLQHGVIKDDLSSWLNNKPIDLFVTSTQAEYNSIAGNESFYNFSAKEVALTGLPRHDKLYLKNNKIKEMKKRIIIMPTWRKALAGKVKSLTNAREYNIDFKESYFFQSWNSFLSSILIKKLAEKGVEVVFFPHANLEPYIKEFDCKYVKVLTHSEVESIQDLFVSSDLMVTDYSSVAFEMAFLEKPVLYFQFDEYSIYTGEHLYSKGYFDYRSDGFGPVASSLEEVFKEIECFQNSNFEVPSLYLERMRAAFPYEKGKACERVYHEIVQRRSQ